jgi:parvulin-like peptidyl-prolyl isomerase
LPNKSGIIMLKKYSIESILCFALVLMIAGPARGVVIDRIVAVVNGEIITLSDLLYEEHPSHKNEAPEIPSQTPAVNQEVLDSFIGKKLLLQLAEKKSIRVPEEQLTQALTDVTRQYGLEDIKQLEQALIQQGLTLEGLKKEIENKIKITKLTNTEVRSKILVSSSEVEEYYQKHLEDFQKQDELKGHHIIFPVSEKLSSQDEAWLKQQLQDIVDRLNQGAKLEELTQDFPVLRGRSWSELDYFKRGELIPELEQAIWNLELGKVALVHTKLGYHIVQLTDRKIHTLENTPQIKNQIEEKIFQQKFQQQSKKWLNYLRRQATIEILP